MRETRAHPLESWLLSMAAGEESFDRLDVASWLAGPLECNPSDWEGYKAVADHLIRACQRRGLIEVSADGWCKLTTSSGDDPPGTLDAFLVLLDRNHTPRMPGKPTTN